MHLTRQEDRLLLPLSFAVAAAHILLIFSLEFLLPAAPAIPKKEKLVVKTIQLNERATVKPVPKPLPELIAEREPEPQSVPEPPAPEPAKAKPEPMPEPERVMEAPPIPEPVKTTPPVPEPVKTTPPKPKPKPKLEKKAPPPPPPKPQKKVEVKKPVPKKEASPKKEAVKRAPAPPGPDPKVLAAEQKKKELVMKARASVAKIDTKRNKDVADSFESLDLPKSFGALQIATVFEEPAEKLTTRERGYREEIASRLKLMLKLPEYGLVKLKLTLSRGGKVIKADIVKSDSASNKKYIQDTLPKLSFPPFGDNFEGEAEHLFPITLSSES